MKRKKVQIPKAMRTQLAASVAFIIIMWCATRIGKDVLMGTIIISFTVILEIVTAAMTNTTVIIIRLRMLKPS